MSRRMVVLGGTGGWHAMDLVRAGREMGIEVAALDFRRIRAALGAGKGGVWSGSSEVSAFESVIVRSMPAGTLEQVIFRMDALHRLEALGARVLNRPRALECCIDKYLTAARLDAAGLQVPPGETAETADEAMAAFDRLGGDVVLKPIFGSEGKGVSRVRSREEAASRFAELEAAGSVIHIQRFIDHPGHDLRLFVLGGSVLAAMRRHAPEDGSFVTNVSRGGRAEALDPSPEVRRLAELAARTVGADAAGVDLVPDREGRHWVLEVNAVPGWLALSAVTGVDVAREILAYAAARD